MKLTLKTLALAGALLFTANAFANDGGIAGIQVRNLKMEKVNYGGEHEVRTPLPLAQGDLVEASFRGSQAAELMKILPGASFVLDGDNYARHFRSLGIAAKEGFVQIHCADADIKYDDNEKATYTPLPSPKCTITLVKHEEPLADADVLEAAGIIQRLSVPRSCQLP